MAFKSSDSSTPQGDGNPGRGVGIRALPRSSDSSTPQGDGNTTFHLQRSCGSGCSDSSTPQGDGNPLATECPSPCRLPVLIPLPRKGTETQGGFQLFLALSCSDSSTPQGDGNKRYTALIRRMNRSDSSTPQGDGNSEQSPPKKFIVGF